MIRQPAASFRLACLAGAVLLSAAWACAADIDPRGVPQDYVKKEKKGGKSVFVWVDDEGWHVRIRNKGKRDFTGVIRVERGKIVGMSGLDQLDGRMAKKKGYKGDVGAISPAGDTLTFKFHTGGKGDGFDFQVSGNALSVAFDFRVDGVSIPNLVSIGAHGASPQGEHFVLPANPAAIAAKEEPSSTPGKKGRAP